MTHKEGIFDQADTESRASLHALGLLEAVRFEWKDDQLFWQSPQQAARLLACHVDNVPPDLLALLTYLSPEATSNRRQALKPLTWNGARYKITYQVTRYDGQTVWLEECGERISGTDSTPSHIVGVLRNIETRKIAESSAAYNADFDALTGLWNAKRMNIVLAQMLAISQRFERPSSYLVFQVTNLGDINATYGYDAGDRLLANLAERVSTHIHKPDTLARISGDSFGIVIYECEQDACGHFAANLKALLSDKPYPSPYGDIYVELALGGVQVPMQADSPRATRKAVQTALYYSRERQGVYIGYSDDLVAVTPARPSSDVSQSDILDALNGRRVTLAFQPIVHAKTRLPHHYECLLRLRRDDGEVVPAGDFIIAAEGLGLVHLLDHRALEIASETLNTVPDIKLALNISAQTLKNTEAAEAYIAALKALGPHTRRVSVELTETAAVEDPAMASNFSEQARALGCTFSIDDFGAGYTTFQNLMAIEADEIKIDGSFIRDLAVTPHKQVFVRMMVDLAQTFSVKTVAEFVNTREDADLLTRLGVDYLQGYMFGVPSTSPDWPGKAAEQGSDPEAISAAQ